MLLPERNEYFGSCLFLNHFGSPTTDKCDFKPLIVKQEKRTKDFSNNNLTCCGPGMPVGPEVASDRDDVEAKTADLGLSEERSGYLVY